MWICVWTCPEGTDLRSSHHVPVFLKHSCRGMGQALFYNLEVFALCDILMKMGTICLMRLCIWKSADDMGSGDLSETRLTRFKRVLFWVGVTLI